MKLLSCVALLCAVVAPLATAQNNNRKMRNNQPYFVINNNAPHPTTGVRFNLPSANHPDYSSGAGVPAGAKVWRTIDTHVDVTLEPLRNTGFSMIIRQSAATTNFNYYEPATGFYGAVPRASNNNVGWDPDFSSPIGASTMQMPSALTGQTARVTVTYAPMTVRFDFENDLRAYTIASDYNGGEEQNLPGDPATGVYSQGFCGSYLDGPILAYDMPHSSYVPDGFWDPTNGILYKPTSNFRWWVTALYDNPVLSLYSDYGQRRTGRLGTPLYGHSDGTSYADIASQSFSLGVTVRAGTTFQAGTAHVLMNILGAPHPTSTGILNPWGGPSFLTVELSPLDPFLTINSVTPAVLDQDGNADIDLLGVGGQGPGTTPPMPFLLGQYVGFEAWVVDSGQTASDTTGAQYLLVSM